MLNSTAGILSELPAGSHPGGQHAYLYLTRHMEYTPVEVHYGPGTLALGHQHAPGAPSEFLIQEAKMDSDKL